MSFHIYPDGVGQGPAPGRTTGSPGTSARPTGSASRCCWGEFGWLDKATRNTGLQGVDRPASTGSAATAGSTGSSSGVQDDGTLYPDYDGFTVYCPSPVCTTLSQRRGES